jgi:hypothetical protein
MRSMTRILGLLTLTGAGAVVYAGCGTAYEDIYVPLTNPALADAGTDGNNLVCTGDPSAQNVTDDCAVFAQADAPPGGDGTREKPFAKLTAAITLAESAGKRVYACASAPFSDAVTISAGIEVYGGFDCAKGWAWSEDARTALNGSADAVALTIAKSAGGAKVEGFMITAASPSDMKGGASSIAVAVADVAATLEDCDVTAADAADGADGATPSKMATPGAAAPSMMAMGAPTAACVLPAGVTGGAPGVTMCSDGMSAGGVGGTGGITGMDSGDGQPGDNGAPLPNPNPATYGVGGVGQTGPTNPTKTCQDGMHGLPGDAGGAGLGGSALGDSLSLEGITNSDLTDGKLGSRGQGGGGGGGSMSGTFCMVASMTVDGPGASAGGGGAGGCGGLGGGGGKAGGSSIAIVSLGLKLTLTEVALTVGHAGKGGQGVIGLGGGVSGAGATGGTPSGLAGSNAGCKGGDGGAGGSGGPGGGGRGGHAIGIAYMNAPATMPVLQMFTPGTPGGSGTGPMGAPATSDGALGNAGPCWNFATNAACGN